jgi:hypothetical protein
MKFYKLLIALIIPVQLFAQDTAVVKRQAAVVANAVVHNNYKIIVDYMYPKAIQMAGGRAQILSLMQKGMDEMKAQGVTIENALIGSPGKFYKAGTEIHCLVPEVITMKMPQGRLTTASNLLAISRDGGKSWTFLDLNRSTIRLIPKMFPHFNPKLTIPEPTQPVMQ